MTSARPGRSLKERCAKLDPVHLPGSESAPYMLPCERIIFFECIIFFDCIFPDMRLRFILLVPCIVMSMPELPCCMLWP